MYIKPLLNVAVHKYNQFNIRMLGTTEYHSCHNCNYLLQPSFEHRKGCGNSEQLISLQTQTYIVFAQQTSWQNSTTDMPRHGSCIWNHTELHVHMKLYQYYYHWLLNGTIQSQFNAIQPFEGQPLVTVFHGHRPNSGT